MPLSSKFRCIFKTPMSAILYKAFLYSIYCKTQNIWCSLAFRCGFYNKKKTPPPTKTHTHTHTHTHTEKKDGDRQCVFVLKQGLILTQDMDTPWWTLPCMDVLIQISMSMSIELERVAWVVVGNGLLTSLLSGYAMDKYSQTTRPEIMRQKAGICAAHKTSLCTLHT